MSELAPGVYESIRTEGLIRRLESLGDLVPHFRAIESSEVPDILARHIARVVRQALLTQESDEARAKLLRELIAVAAAPDEQPAGELAQLMALTRAIAPGVHEVIRPLTPLSDAALLTNTKGEPSLSKELQAELASADEVCLLCAFVRWHGLRVLEQPLTELRERGVRLRVITTTYMGATERRAVDELVNRFGAEVRVCYETRSTRLHAKAWLLRRNTGYDTAFVGSSNLSKSALVDGLEWNVRLSGVATPELLRKFEATFDTYWADQHFAPYDPGRDGDTLSRFLDESSTGRPPLTLSGLQVEPLPHQRPMLEALASERQVHDRHRNLVVAATGTGKTVLAALDYRGLSREAGRRPSLLFVAHRSEILDQALRTYREVLADGAFGELWVGGRQPQAWKHVFASVQSLSQRRDAFAADAFEIVVIDEFHHAQAASYRRLLEQLEPVELVGLTATPERSDGIDVRSFFDGRTAYELPLWDALAADLLVPFHYFGLADDVDLRDVEWKRGAYDIAGLERVYTGNDARAAKVIKAVQHEVSDVHRMRAIGFCVSVDHAAYMADMFNRAGIRSLAITGRTSEPERKAGLDQLRQGEVNCVFTVDLLNEGLDIPSVDTLLLLRPTQSATLFLQQLGRGLRRAEGKPVLTVLDFIGQQRREFRFDLRFRALTGTTRRGVQDQIKLGFPFLPSGSQIVLDRVAQQIVLDNVRQQLRSGRRQLVEDLRSHGDLRLADFVHESGRELRELYRSNGSWTALRREAGLPAPEPGPGEASLLRRVSALIHVDDVDRRDLYTAMADPAGPSYDELDERQQRLARMLFFLLWPDLGGFTSYQAGFDRLRQNPAMGQEIRDLLALTVDQSRSLPEPLELAAAGVPLQSHAWYRREEILAAIDWASLNRQPSRQREGVAWSESLKIDALLVTLKKTEKDFSPTTMYRDYAISPELFHWESQNSTTLKSPTGRRYLDHRAQGSDVVLFLRETANDDVGTAPYLCAGGSTYLSHAGQRPIAITWQLDRAMPEPAFRVASVVGS